MLPAPGLRKGPGTCVGAAVFELIEQEPSRLREVTGIGAKRAARIVAGWADQKVIREIMLFLGSPHDQNCTLTRLPQPSYLCDEF